MDIDFDSLMTTLAKKRPIFHSEADFQHALAWELRERLPEVSIRLERPVPWEEERGHIDLWIRGSDGDNAVELKYWSRRFVHQVGDEYFYLKNQAAQDVSRYDFVKDVRRMERAVASGLAKSAFVIALTNDSGYWRIGRANSIDAAFRLSDGYELAGSRAWDPRAGLGTTRRRETAIDLSGVYPLVWRDYSRLSDLPGAEFRYLLIKVRQSDSSIV